MTFAELQTHKYDAGRALLRTIHINPYNNNLQNLNKVYSLVSFNSFGLTHQDWKQGNNITEFKTKANVHKLNIEDFPKVQMSEA